MPENIFFSCLTVCKIYDSHPEWILSPKVSTLLHQKRPTCQHSQFRESDYWGSFYWGRNVYAREHLFWVALLYVRLMTSNQNEFKAQKFTLYSIKNVRPVNTHNFVSLYCWGSFYRGRNVYAREHFFWVALLYVSLNTDTQNEFKAPKFPLYSIKNVRPVNTRNFVSRYCWGSFYWGRNVYAQEHFFWVALLYVRLMTDTQNEFKAPKFPLYSIKNVRPVNTRNFVSLIAGGLFTGGEMFMPENIFYLFA
jgi:hypothetical protein